MTTNQINNTEIVGSLVSSQVLRDNEKDITQIMQNVQTMEIFVSQIADTHKVVKNELTDAEIVYYQMQQSLIQIKKCLKRLSDLNVNKTVCSGNDPVELEETYVDQCPVQNQEEEAKAVDEMLAQHFGEIFGGGDEVEDDLDVNVESEKASPAFKCGGKRNKSGTSLEKSMEKKKTKRFFNWYGSKKNACQKAEEIVI